MTSDQPTPSSKLRSIAFALLGRREYSASELKTKLVALGAKIEDIEPLLSELMQSNYQSDERMAGMLVRSNLRKGRGISRIQQDLKKHQIDVGLAADEINQVDWLQQAIELRIKKFGALIPKDAKERNRQLRFLQYRGFDLDICFKALNSNGVEEE